MNDRLAGYLGDLDARLRAHLDDACRAEVLAELRSHLTLSARDAEAELEMTADEAARAALRALGPVATVAEDLVRQHRGGTTKPAWRVALPTLILYSLGYGLVPLLWALNPNQLGWILPYLVLPFLCLVAYVVAVWRSRRWLFPVVLAGVFVTTILGMTVTRLPVYREAAAASLGGEAAIRRTRLQEIERDLALVALGPEGYLRQPDRFARSGLYVVPRWQQVGSYAFLPFLPIMVPTGSKQELTLSPDTWSAENAELWRTNGPALREKLRHERALLLSDATDWTGFYSAFAQHAAGFGLVNLVVLAASNRRRRRRIRQDPHLA